jgi:hypothetical protein
LATFLAANSSSDLPLSTPQKAAIFRVVNNLSKTRRTTISSRMAHQNPAQSFQALAIRQTHFSMTSFKRLFTGKTQQ